MYYYEEKDNYIDKYKVNIDIAKLTFIYHQLIDKCSFIEDITETKDDIKDVSSTNEYYVKDYSYKMLKNGKYSLHYKRYNKCELAKIIELLFRKDVKGIFKLYNYNPLSNEEKDNLKIKELSNKIDRVDNAFTKEKINLLKEMEFLLQEIEFNKNRKEEIEYINDIKKLIEFEYMGSLSKDVFNNVNLFFEKDMNLNINNKVLKKEI